MFFFLGIIVVCFFLTFIISHIFLSIYVYQRKQKFWNDAFSYVFGLSNIMLLSMILDIADFGDDYIRKLCWRYIVWIFITLMYFIIPYYMIKNFFSKNAENKTYFKSLIEKIKIAFSYTLYLFTTCLLYSYFKGDKYKWYSLIFYFEFKMEFIALISIIFTSVFSGYSSVQCIFNYLIHPYCLGVNTVDSLKDFLNVKTNKLILICLPKNSTSSTTSSLYKNNKTDDDKEGIDIKKSYTTTNLIGNVNMDSVFNNKFDEFLNENDNIEEGNSYYLNTIQETSASNLNLQALTYPDENKDSIKNINTMNHNLDTSQDILDNSNVETKPTLTYSQINCITNTNEVDYNTLSKNKNSHKEENNDYDHAIDKWHLAHMGKSSQQDSEILYNNKETDTTFANKSTNSNKVKDCSNISNNDYTVKKHKRNTIKRQSKSKRSTSNSKLPPYIDHDFEFSFPTYPALINFLTKVYCFTIFKNEANNINYEEIKKFILNLIKNLIHYKDNKINKYQLRIITLRQNLYNYFNWVLFYFFGKVLGIYSAYKVLITTKNYFMSNYSEINDMLKDELINIIDKILSISFYILTFENDSLLYTIIEQYFSLVVVGSILIVNIRSFLNTIHFLYTRAISKIDFNNNALETSFMTYCVGMFYITSSILIIFSLPKTYRTNIVNVYEKLDYSLLKFYWDKSFIMASLVVTIIEIIFLAVSLFDRLDVKSLFVNSVTTVNKQ